MASKHLVFWSVAVFVFLLDRISKLLILNFVPLNSSFDIGIVSISHFRNTGTLFGLFRNASWFFVLFAVLVSAYIIWKYSSFSKQLQPVLGLILAGALGNLVDRLVYGSVIDFIDFHFWPAFNVADSAISIAVVVLLVREYVLNKRNI